MLKQTSTSYTRLLIIASTLALLTFPQASSNMHKEIDTVFKCCECGANATITSCLCSHLHCLNCTAQDTL